MKLRFIPLDRYKGVLTPAVHSQLVKELLEAQDYSSNSNSETEEVIESSSSSHSDHKRNDWLQPMTHRDLLLLKLRQKIRKQVQRRRNRTSLFQVGCYVYTTSALIAPLSDEPVESRCTRKKMAGTVVKESAYFPGIWLVYFFSLQKYYYCAENVIKFVSPTDPTNQITKLHDNKLTSRPIGINKGDQDLVMSYILNSKMYKTPGHRMHSVKNLCSTFKAQYPWLTVNKMNNFLAEFRVGQKYAREVRIREEKYFGDASKYATEIEYLESNNFVTPGMYHILLLYL